MMRAFRLALVPLLLLGLAAPAQAAAERKKGGGLSYTQFPALTATIVRANGRRGVLSVEAGVDCPDPAVKARTDLLEPRLRDAYVSFLVTYAATLSAGAPPAADQIAAALQRRTDQVVGRPGARFLLGTILVN